MRLKGISVFEQHIEKVVLAVMVCVLLGVVSMQFLYQPNMIDTGGRKVPPQAVFGELRKEVDRLRAEVNDGAPPLPEVVTPDLRGAYQQAISQQGSVPEELDIAFGPAPRIGGAIDLGPVVDGPIMAMTVPAPGNALGNAQWIAVDPYVLEENPDLASYLPPEQPYDMPGVTVSAVIDGRALQDLLREGDGEHRPIPSSWVRGGLAVLGVEAERQRQNIDGTWGPTEQVEPVPGAFKLLTAAESAKTLNPVELREVVLRAEQSADLIARPDYLPAIAGPEWLEPEKAMARDEQLARMSEVDVLRHRRSRVLDRIEQNRRRLEASPDANAPTRERGNPELVPGGGKGGGLPGQPQRDPGADQRAKEREQQREERRRQQILNTIKDLEGQVAQIEKELADKGFPVASEDRLTTPAEAERRDPLLNRGLLGNESFKVWAHDIAVEPGAVYRYRLRVRVNNPIYGKERLLDAGAGDDLELARQPYAFSEWSAWTNDVMVGKETYLFLTAGNEAKQAGDALATLGGGGAKVSAEVYHMYYGHYRRGSATLTPGDSVYTDVRLPDRLYLFDTAKVSREEAYRLAGVTPDDRRRVPNMPYPPSRAPYMPIPGNPGERDAPNPEFVKPGPQQSPEFVPYNPGGTPGGPTQAALEPEELPDGVTESPDRVTVTMDVILLDVVELPLEVPGGGARPRAVVYAYFETEGGVVEHRRVDEDTQSRAYELVRASYRLGEPDESETAATP
ncbi:MAG: hypothetical protein DYG94_03515 [Leptolyngbya sp. PLA3]|nr:MAG: hypothetical protein EDM82_09025 [Cyanobacteria bacterium CYA]MCE7967797.1 hypothetical protein [Leptolyngbya sp. PL-A3]